MAKEITCKVTKPIEVLGENDRGYTKEVNLVSWNNASAKLDIREWHPEHERCGKGITLSETRLMKTLQNLRRCFRTP